MTTTDDLRPTLTSAQEWVASLIAGIGDDQWKAPTPCTEFDVTALVEHLFAVQQRIVLLATVGSVTDAATSLPMPAGDVAQAFRARAGQGELAWAAWSAEELATRTVTHPIGIIPGSVAVTMYADENLVHGWDLAVATGQSSEAPGELVEPVLARMQGMLPAQRPPHLPFFDAVTPREGAGPTERLANWMGRLAP